MRVPAAGSSDGEGPSPRPLPEGRGVGRIGSVATSREGRLRPRPIRALRPRLRSLRPWSGAPACGGRPTLSAKPPAGASMWGSWLRVEADRFGAAPRRAAAAAARVPVAPAEAAAGPAARRGPAARGARRDPSSAAAPSPHAAPGQNRVAAAGRVRHVLRAVARLARGAVPRGGCCGERLALLAFAAAAAAATPLAAFREIALGRRLAEPLRPLARHLLDVLQDLEVVRRDERGGEPPRPARPVRPMRCT